MDTEMLWLTCFVFQVVLAGANAANSTVIFSSSVSGSNSSSTQASQAPLPTLSQANVAASPTMTVNVPSSMLSPSATAAQQPASSSTNQEWMKSCAVLDWTPNLQSCSTKKCVEDNTAAMEAHAECIKKGDKPENVSSFSLVPMVQHYGLELAKFYVANGMGVNETGFIFKKLFAFGSGLVSGNDINDTSEDYLKFPDYSNPDHFTGAWQMLRDEIKISPKMLRDRGVHSFPYTWSVFSDLYDLSAMSEREVEVDLMKRIADSYISDLYVDDYGRLRTNKKFPDITLNSQVFTFSPLSPMGKLDKPLLVTLRHRKVQGFANPRCVSWNPTRRMYHTKGCSVHETNETHTVCACEHFGSYAVAMDKTIPDDATERETVVTVAWVLSTISLLCLIICAACIIVVGYHFVDNMRIALCLDVSLALGYLIFYFGLSSGNTNFYASRSSCDVISPLMHLFQLAALTWLLMEGLHYVSVFKKVFNKENSQPWYIYTAVGWGVPIAFAGACAGYTYPHGGVPKQAEFCWLPIEGTELWYFAGPGVILVALNLLVRSVVLVEVLTWKGDPDDVNIERTRFRLLSFIVLLLVVILTWVFGVLAANSSEKKGFHYAFIVLFALQGILVAVFYAAQNKELWDYYRQKKEKKLKEKTAVFHFEYIP
ncbi:adhesion G protein-coupled receptor L1 isoform X2 [Nematostella vectensis]|uniref:adhesion G protein-coupled receptor L1 isoform X2 n=1 Tax=Nematostella vectensis TaxID=45351 RepID=UPI0020775273|nr:adhesion G protein-coupled receptor L1 isoform X2 [Nematostella vectensis]